jgi:phosphoenolpyruvate carboxylase
MSHDDQGARPAINRRHDRALPQLARICTEEAGLLNQLLLRTGISAAPTELRVTIGIGEADIQYGALKLTVDNKRVLKEIYDIEID